MIFVPANNPPTHQAFTGFDALVAGLQHVYAEAAADPFGRLRIFVFRGSRLFIVGDPDRRVVDADGRAAQISPAFEPTDLADDVDDFLLPPSQRRDD